MLRRSTDTSHATTDLDVEHLAGQRLWLVGMCRVGVWFQKRPTSGNDLPEEGTVDQSTRWHLGASR